MDARKVLSKALWVVVPLVTIAIIWGVLQLMRNSGGGSGDPKALSQLTSTDIWSMVIIHAVLSGSLASK